MAREQGQPVTTSQQSAADRAAEPPAADVEAAQARERRAEIADLTRRVVIGAVLTAPVLYAVMAQPLLGAHWVPTVLTQPLDAAGADHPGDVVRGLADSSQRLAGPGPPQCRHEQPHHARHGRRIRLQPASHRCSGVLPAEVREVYFEAAGVVLTLIMLGRLLEARAKAGTGEAIRALRGQGGCGHPVGPNHPHGAAGTGLQSAHPAPGRCHRGVFRPFVIAIAIATFATWFITGSPPAVTQALVSAVAVLIIACPCALGLATPLSIMVGTGKGARATILIRSAQALESAHHLDTIVLDKTGTITAGKPALTDVHAVGAMAQDELLTLVAAAEAASEHPVASAIVAAARDRGHILPPAEDFASITGKGVRANVAEHTVLIGTPKLLGEAGIDISELELRGSRPREKLPSSPPLTANPLGCWRSPIRLRTILSPPSRPCTSSGCRL